MFAKFVKLQAERKDNMQQNIELKRAMCDVKEENKQLKQRLNSLEEENKGKNIVLAERYCPTKKRKHPQDVFRNLDLTIENLE